MHDIIWEKILCTPSAVPFASLSPVLALSRGGAALHLTLTLASCSGYQQKPT